MKTNWHNTQLHSQARRESEKAWQLPTIKRLKRGVR